MKTIYGSLSLLMRDGSGQPGDLAIAEEQFNRDIYRLDDLSKLLTPETILDVGGHIGCFGLKAKSLWPGARLVAYEPNHESARLYRENLEKNGFDGEVVRAAVSYEPRKTVLADNPVWAGGGIMVQPDSRVGVPETYYVSETSVPLATMEEVIECHGLKRIDLLKFDCERAEIEILRQMNPETAGKIGFIVGEYHWEGPGYFGFQRLLKERFPKFAVMPIGKPSANIGLFGAGPVEIIEKLRQHPEVGPPEAVITPLGNAVLLDFNDGARVDIIGTVKADYRVRFDDEDTGVNIYATTIGPCQFAAANPKYYVRWRVTVQEDGVPVMDHLLDLKDRRVLVALTSKSLGDTVAWMPYAEEFRQRHGSTVHVETFWRSILEAVYPDIKVFDPGKIPIHDYYASYRIGAFDNDYHRNKNNWRAIPLQQVATDALGMDFHEVRPRVVRSDQARLISDRYVAITEFSTFQGKAWNHPSGWATVVRHLRSIGYQVMSISREPTGLADVIRMNGKPIEETIRNIQHADLFIGVSSGPMWLAYALGVPAVVISGFTEPYSEMTDCIRVHNPVVCHGCYNDLNYPFDRANWNWCPRSKAFECSKEITPKTVIDRITPLVQSQESVRAVAPKNQENQRVLFLTPHLSTGGLPQYLLACVRELVQSGAEVEVVEWTCLSPHYVVQRKQIEHLCRLHALSGDKHTALQRIIETFEPNTIHAQEFVESWTPPAVADWLFRPGHSYHLVETTHDLRFRPEGKRYRPDGLALVCRWHMELFAGLGIPRTLVEYKPQLRVRPDRNGALKALGLDPDKRHVLNVGLFTPNKAQDVIFEAARKLAGVQFHFVGNQAPNFASYWQPLMADKPANCTIWGEREDVGRFYAAMDLLLFTSRSELAPLVPKEALAWGMPVLMRNLPVYMGAYDGDPLVSYLPEKPDAVVDLLTAKLLPTAAALRTVYRF